jgi:hypothetical protein
LLPEEEQEPLDLPFGVSLSDETMLWAPIMPGLLIWILILLPDFLAFLLLSLRMWLRGEERKVVLDFMALSTQLFESPPTLMIDGRRI